MLLDSLKKGIFGSTPVIVHPDANIHVGEILRERMTIDKKRSLSTS